MSDPRPPATSYAPRVTYKRPYKKSTLGCTECKARRIKCDETRPSCSNCRRRFANSSRCQYAAADNKKGFSERSYNSTKPPMCRMVSSNPIAVTHSNLMELRLIHHYTRSTCNRKPQKYIIPPALPDTMWEVDIPRLAFSSDLVLTALLGIAASNLLSLNPNDRSLASASKSYFNKAVQKQCVALNSIGPNTIEPLFVAGAIIAHHHWLLTNSDESQEPYLFDLGTYYMCKGTAALAESTTDLLTKYETLEDNVIKHGLDESKYDEEFMKEVLQDMDVLSRVIEKDAKEEDKKVYLETAAEVVSTCSLIAGNCVDNSILEQMLVTILHRVPQPFIQMLKAKDPIAMALFARNISLLGVFEDTTAWWIHGAGNSRVGSRAIRCISSQMPPEYLWLMDWPSKMVSKQVKVI